MDGSLLKDKSAIITGCNRGIGRAILEKFSNYKANCIACVREESKDFYELCHKLEKKNKKKINIIKLNLLDEDSISNSVKNIFKVTKNIDVLVNNAGILFNSLFQMTSSQKLKEIFQVNFFSQVYLTQLISRVMQKNKKGSIIFISSTSAEGRDYGRFAYSSSKAAISSLARVLAKELGNYNIRVNSINPGLTNTDMMKSNIKKDALDFELKKTSLGRIAESFEVADLVAFLASDLSTYITGQNIRIDGGLQ